MEENGVNKSKILIIDDDYSIRELLKVILGTMYKIKDAGSGYEALKSLKNFNPDLILLDVMLPDASGFDLCRSITLDPGFSKTPVILITGKTNDKDLEKGFEAGAIDYIKKPFSYVELKARVKAYLKLSKYIMENAIIKEGLVSEKEKTRVSLKTKSDFLANMSHEIRTPMTAIMGMSKLLLDTELNDEQKEFADSIYSSTEVLMNVINDILDFSKIESGKFSLTEEFFDLEKTIEDAVNLESFNAFEKGLDLNCFFASEFNYNYAGDKGRLRQVILNLLSNAVKFTEKGNVLLKVEKKWSDDFFDEILFEVSDTGIGISKENMNKLFKDFSQIDSKLSRRYSGTGLGLAISKQLIDLMGGEIFVESEENKGSKFYFTIKLKKGNPLNKNYEKIDKEVVLVTNNELSYKIIDSYLIKIDSKTIWLKSAKECFDFFKNTSSEKSVAIIDARVDNMDGWFIAQEINSGNKNKNNRLILLAQYKTQIQEAKMKNLKWFDGYIDKPLRRNALYKIVKELVYDDIPVLETYDSPETNNDFDINLSIKILVCEDNEINQKLLSTILKKIGVSFDSAKDGNEAVEKALKNDYDMILMDIQMPFMDGYEATKLIRGKNLTVPIIGISANAFEDDIEKGKKNGMNDYITKPYNKDKISEVIYKWGIDFSKKRLIRK